MQYRFFTEHDFEAMQALESRALHAETPDLDQLPEREREGRRRSSLPALRFFARSEHSFVAEEAGRLLGFILAQPVWQGDRPTVLVVALTLEPGAAPEVARGLLHATVKSAYDSAVYEVHLTVTPALEAAARAEEARSLGRAAVIHLGTRAQTAPGEAI